VDFPLDNTAEAARPEERGVSPLPTEIELTFQLISSCEKILSQEKANTKKIAKKINPLLLLFND
jgi:hypothetical protein